MKTRVLILGAGFGGLELATMLSDEVADEVEVTLIDRNDAFIFGYSKLDVMFGRGQMADARLPYSSFVKPGVRLLREEITSIDPEAKLVTTDAGTHEADVLVVALGVPPKITYVIAQVCHITRKEQSGRRMYLVGCNYVGRATY